MSNRGIDYSPVGSTINRDSETGIRYGIISAHAMTEWFWEDVESVYIPRCVECFEELSDEQMTALHDTENPECPHCEKSIDPDDEGIYGDSPDENIIDTDDIKGFVDSSNDVWVVSSPFYTRGVFCSPCCPGAVSIGSPCDDGAKAYCFPHSWYDGAKAPHPVYRVSDDSLVIPDDGLHCPSCGMRHTEMCIAGGRCIGCMSMLCALPLKPEGEGTNA